MLGYDVKAEAPFVVFYDREKRGAIIHLNEYSYMHSIRAENIQEVYIERDFSVRVYFIRGGVEEEKIKFHSFTFDTFEDADAFAASVRGRVREAGQWRRG